MRGDMEKWRSRSEAVRAEDVQTLGECCECVRVMRVKTRLGCNFWMSASRWLAAGAVASPP